MARRLTAEQRTSIVADAARWYGPGETWGQTGADHGITGEHVRRLTTDRHDITYRRWGQRPVVRVDEVCRRRDMGQSLNEIGEVLGCSRQAVRTALETAGRTSATRYPRLSSRRTPTPIEIERMHALYEACPEAPRNRPGHLVRRAWPRTDLGALAPRLPRPPTRSLSNTEHRAKNAPRLTR